MQNNVDGPGDASSSASSGGIEAGVEVTGPRTKRCYNLEGPNRREPRPGKTSALEQALYKFADRTSDYIINPSVGTEFDSWEEGYEYYNMYSWECGFGIRCGKRRFSESSKQRGVPYKDRYMISLELRCSCAGKPDGDTTVSSRTDCPAMVRLHRTEDHGWVVTEHRAAHNHPLSETCGEKRQWPSHKHIDKYTKDLIRILRENNIGLTKIYSILGSFFGSMHNVPTTKRTLRNICQSITREQAEDDIKKTLMVFREFREADPGFLYSVDLDEDGRIKTLMWTNSRSRMQYAHFGDVVTFDTTYRTNMYDMPFGLFVGVNNHFQTVIFGGVLVTEETIESFKWVFKEFVSMMGGKLPQTVLTDQCRAMEVALSAVWKDVAHIWCKWHVLRRVRECVGPKYTGNKEFRDKFHKMLNEMLTVQEFEAAWHSLLSEYDLSENPFLKQIYETRERWAKCFFNGVFCAKQTSTQRSESANHMVKGLVPPGCSINHFVRQYAKLQHTIDDNENYEERRTKLFNRDLSLGGPLVHHASKVYTFKVFGMFCKIKTESEYYFANEVVPGREYMAQHYNLEKVQRWCKGQYVVKVNEDRTMFKCECGLFEHFGLPCCHALRVMICLGVKSIPEPMIMLRWTKRARMVLPAHLAEYGQPNPALMAQTYRHAALFIAVLELVKLGDSNVKCFHIAMACILEAKEKLLEVSKDKDGLGLADREAAASQSAAGNEETINSEPDPFPLRAPTRKRSAGRPANRRDKPGYEKLSKRPRFCRTCKSPDHKSDKCPQRDPAL
ncbi:hypothetical protein EJB05_15130, partial [Eragrostis curvula]